MKGIVTQTLDWITHPLYSDANLSTWAAFLALILIASFLWSMVVTQIKE